MKLAKPRKTKLKTTWTVTVGDGYCAWTYKIEGRADASIKDVARAATRLLKGKVSREWCSEEFKYPPKHRNSSRLIAP